MRNASETDNTLHKHAAAELLAYAEQMEDAPIDQIYRPDEQMQKLLQNVFAYDPGLRNAYQLAASKAFVQKVFRPIADSMIKAKVLFSCILQSDDRRTEYLAQILLDTAEYPHFYRRNSWELLLRNTLNGLMDCLDHEYEYKITAAIRAKTFDLVTRMKRPLRGYMKISIEDRLLPHTGNQAEIETYIERLLYDIELVVLPYLPEKYSGAPSVNARSEEIRRSFHVLDQIGHADLIADFMSLFMNYRGTLRPVTFYTWMRQMLFSVSPDGMAVIANRAPTLFAVYREEDKGAADDLHFAAQRLQKSGYTEEAKIVLAFVAEKATI